ncbi:endonuclease domain-containing protein [Streptomyces sp. NPDC059766]|uniref:endonuclease domain-containing protein n=1 Tax=Streptomyces sp. NPDC059766 TaxID=3346940 RepID=UPI00365FBA03
MSQRVTPGRTDGLLTLGAADALWVDLTAGSAVPTASGAFTRSPSRAGMGYVLLGAQVVATVRAGGGQWSVAEAEVRRAAAELSTVAMDRRDLVRVGPFRGVPRQQGDEETPLRWRRRIAGELREQDGPERAARRDDGRPYHLAGIDWRRILVVQTHAGPQRTWWLPRAVVRLLDAAEHAETQWVHTARTGRAGVAATEPSARSRGEAAAASESPVRTGRAGVAAAEPLARSRRAAAAATEPPGPTRRAGAAASESPVRTGRAGVAAAEPPAPTRRAGVAAAESPAQLRQVPEADGRRTTSPRSATAVPRPYGGELEGRLYSVLSRQPGTSRQVAGWTCAVCRTAPAAVLDHCHEHGYVRAPLCQSCNTQERPDHLYSNDIRVANRYTRLFGTDAVAWLRHWHRCPGCRARTTLPLPHLAAWTAHTACRSLRPTHPASRGRKPCGVLRVSWTGSQNAPRSCLLTVTVDFCPSGEHRVLAQVPYREAVERFRRWLAETAPAVAAAAGPDRLDDLPAQSRPVVEDTGGEGLSLF